MKNFGTRASVYLVVVCGLMAALYLALDYRMSLLGKTSPENAPVVTAVSEKGWGKSISAFLQSSSEKVKTIANPKRNEVYKYLNERGEEIYTNTPPSDFQSEKLTMENLTVVPVSEQRPELNRDELPVEGISILKNISGGILVPSMMLMPEELE